jgi:predicted RecA/RadA family phage recombinase
MTAEKLTVGQEVRIFHGRRFAEVGTPGTLTKVGRKWATASYEAEVHDWRGNTSREQREIEFGILNGYERGDSFGTGYIVMTLPQVAAKDRMKGAESVLREHRVELRTGHSLTLEQVEAIAAILRPDHKPEGN